jgi:hypothetical protein
MTTKLQDIGRTLAAITLITTLAVAAPALAGDDDGNVSLRNRKGLLVGVNAGWGHSMFSEQVGSRTYSDDPYSGGTVGLRFGYAFHDALALTAEAHGFGSNAGQDEWGMGAGLLVLTWWPRGGGLFVRAGVGAGGGEVLLRETGEILHFEDKATGMFGIGYEWMVGRNLGLSLVADGLGIDLDGISGRTDDVTGSSSVSIQLNWYL